MRATPLASVFVLSLLLAGAAPVAADHRGRGAFGKMAVEGVIHSVHRPPSTFVLRVTRPDGWRRVPREDLVVWVQRGTEIRNRFDDDHDNWDGAFFDFRVGDAVKVDGFRLDDGRLLAMEVEVRHREPFFRPPDHGTITIHGVLIAKGAGVIIVIDSSGAARIILVATATVVTGRRNSLVALQTQDALSIVGSITSNGSIAAREIRVVDSR